VASWLRVWEAVNPAEFWAVRNLSENLLVQKIWSKNAKFGAETPAPRFGEI